MSARLRRQSARLNNLTAMAPLALIALLVAVIQSASAQLALAESPNFSLQQLHLQPHLPQLSSGFEQLAASLAAAASGYQQQAPSSAISESQIQPAASDGSSASKTRSPRSISDMIKKLFNGSRRSKASSSPAGRDLESSQSAAAAVVAAQQHAHAAQNAQLQHQQNQAANLASLAAAAANQQAVYASPFNSYTPQGQFYPQFAGYSPAVGGSIFTWPNIRTAPTLIAAASGVQPADSPLYAAASQAYNSYAIPPQSPQTAQSQAQTHMSPVALQSPMAAGQMNVAASHQSSLTAPPPPPPLHQPQQSSGSIDFHQVLDALVRTSGFAPAGDHEAAANSGYKDSPVFSFKKLYSFPFYLSTEEKQTEALPNASPDGYSVHSMPIMRRHVPTFANNRRMSASVVPQQAQQQVRIGHQLLQQLQNISPAATDSRSQLQQGQSQKQQQQQLPQPQQSIQQQ